MWRHPGSASCTNGTSRVSSTTAHRRIGGGASEDAPANGSNSEVEQSGGSAVGVGAGGVHSPGGPAGGADGGSVDWGDGGGGQEGRVVRFSALLAGRGYLRPLVTLYGRRLRTCAVLDELRRTHVGAFSVDDAWSWDALLPLLKRYGGSAAGRGQQQGGGGRGGGRGRGGVRVLWGDKEDRRR